MYLKRQFEEIQTQVQMHEREEHNPLLQHFKVAQAIYFIQHNLMDSQKTYQYFQK